MDLATGLAIAVPGAFVGMLVVVSVMRWIATVWDMSRPKPELGRNRFSIAMALSVSAFHSAPWLLAACGSLAYYVHREPWAPWLLGGAVASVLYLGLVVAIGLRRFKAKDAA